MDPRTLLGVLSFQPKSMLPASTNTTAASSAGYPPFDGRGVIPAETVEFCDAEAFNTVQLYRLGKTLAHGAGRELDVVYTYESASEDALRLVARFLLAGRLRVGQALPAHRVKSDALRQTTLFIGGANREDRAECEARPTRIQSALEKLFGGNGEQATTEGPAELALSEQECKCRTWSFQFLQPPSPSSPSVPTSTAAMSDGTSTVTESVTVTERPPPRMHLPAREKSYATPPPRTRQPPYMHPQHPDTTITVRPQSDSRSGGIPAMRLFHFSTRRRHGRPVESRSRLRPPPTRSCP